MKMRVVLTTQQVERRSIYLDLAGFLMSLCEISSVHALLTSDDTL